VGALAGPERQRAAVHTTAVFSVRLGRQQQGDVRHAGQRLYKDIIPVPERFPGEFMCYLHGSHRVLLIIKKNKNYSV